MNSLRPDQALAQARRVWVLYLVWQGSFLVTHVVLWVRGYRVLFDGVSMTLMQVALGLLVVFLMWSIRAHYYKAYWVKDCVTPEGYLRAHQFMGLLPFVVTLLAFPDRWRAYSPGLPLGVFPAALFFLALWLMFPDGKPMQDHPVRL